MIDYRQMIETAVKNGGGDKAMWSSVDLVNELMGYMHEHHIDMYHHYMRKSYEALYGKHYNKEFAEEDVARLHYTDKEGKEHYGAHWTVEQIKDATAQYKFPEGTTSYDKYVAFNAAYADFSKKFDDTQVLCIGWLFFFADEDWKGEGKVWEYMSINK